MQTDPAQNLTFDICWTDMHVKPELFARMQPHQKINHYPGTTYNIKEWQCFQEKIIWDWG